MTQMNQELIEKTKAKIERLKIRLSDLESPAPLGPPGPTYDEIVRDALHLALKRNYGSRTNAAKELAVSVRTIRNWINKYGEENGSL